MSLQFKFRRAAGIHPLSSVPSNRDQGAHGAPRNAPDISLLDLSGCLGIRPIFEGRPV